LSTDPIESAWKDAARAKHRFDYNAWYLSYSAFSIFFDIAILCFPIPVIKTLRLDRKRKISIIGIFWLGGFVCVSAIVRLVLLYQSIYQVTDFGKNQYSAYTRAFIIAACLPTYGPLFKEGGLGPRMSRSLRTMMGRFRESGRNAESSDSSDATVAGYYSLDKVTSDTKNSDDILTGTTTTKLTSLGSQLERDRHVKSVDEEALDVDVRI
jgi:hypothetical protein